MTAAISSRPEFADLTPVPQDDGPTPLVVIDYSPEFREAHDLFRAIVQKNELSERALALTEEVIQQNAANYTAWYYRRLCLKALGKDLAAELEFASQWGKQSPKNYQVWYHRRWLVNEMNDPSKELQFVAEALEEDAKTYNAWSHRQWICQHYKLWADELPYVEQLLTEDVRNNSAWNHRYFVLEQNTIDDEVREREIKFALAKLDLVPDNESAWNYLAAFFGKGPGRKSWATASKELIDFCHEVAHCSAPCRFAIEALANIAIANGEKEEALAHYNTLMSLDKIRRNYWLWKSDALGIDVD